MATRAAFSDDEFGHSFDEEWPELARRLERFLAAKGVETWLRADVVQETGTCLYRKWSRLDRSRPLWNLVVTIALGALVDERRKASRVELVPDVPQSEVDDVETRALHRLHLVKTRAALKQLRADQRRVLLAEIGEAAAFDAPRNRINVLRLRARASLRERLGPWAPSAITIRLRLLRGRVAQKRFALEMHMPAMANSLVTVAMATTLGLAGAPGAAVGAGNPVSTERAPLLTMTELRDLNLDAVASIRRPEPPDLSKGRDRAKKADAQERRFVDDTREELKDQVQEVDDQRKAAEDWAEESKDEVEEQSEEIEDQKDEVEDQKEWAECYVTNQC